MIDPIRIIPCGLVAGASSTVRVRLDVLKERRVCDARVWDVSGPGQIAMPTRHGWAVQVRHLPALIAALQHAQAEAEAAGLLENGE